VERSILQPQHNIKGFKPATLLPKRNAHGAVIQMKAWRRKKQQEENRESEKRKRTQR